MKVYATALFGDNDRYSQYLKAWLLGALNLFPQRDGWQLFVATDDAAYYRYEKLFVKLWGERLIDMCTPARTAPLCRAMLWRMLPIFGARSAEYVFCRDVDAPPMPRDRACCDAFVLSKAAVHTIHDSDQHVGIMGGLCGFWASEFRKLAGLQSLDDLYRFAGLTDAQWGRHGADQDVLNRLVRERVRLTLLEHRYAGWHDGPGKKPKREAGAYSCGAFSTLMPDYGPWPNSSRQEINLVSWKTPIQADLLGAHLGCAGYDYEAAIKFWNEHGDPAISKIIGEL